MATPFARTWRSLDADRAGWTIAGIVTAATLAVGFGVWCKFVTVPLYEVAATARIEASRAVYPVASPVSGRVTQAGLVIGREVKEGDILVELDSTAEQLQVAEERTRLTALRSQAAALSEQVNAEAAARAQEQKAAGTGRAQSQADAREAEAAAGQAESEARRAEQLFSSGLTSEKEYRHAQAEAKRLRAAADSRGIAVEHGGQDQLTRAADRTARIQGLESQIAGLESQMPSVEASIERLRHEMERRRVRAPMDGVLGEVALIRPGAVVKEGERLGTVVPDGRLRAVAQFPAEAAMGRMQPGQPARLRLDGFPWIEYGSLTAHVARVASEVRDGAVRVEFALDPAPGSRIRLQHGLPGSVEVEIGRVTPWTLLMRHVGRQWSAGSGEKGARAEAAPAGGF